MERFCSHLYHETQFVVKKNICLKSVLLWLKDMSLKFYHSQTQFSNYHNNGTLLWDMLQIFAVKVPCQIRHVFKLYLFISLKAFIPEIDDKILSTLSGRLATTNLCNLLSSSVYTPLCCFKMFTLPSMHFDKKSLAKVTKIIFSLHV